MANYFVINNKFRPYSFDELIKPYEIYGQAYKEQEAAVEAAREKEFSAANLDSTLDKAAYDMYNTASGNLQAASDELATRGLSAGLRGRIKAAARDYKSTMDTLTEAQKRLDAERTRRVNLGNDYVYRQEDVRIGDFLNGSAPDQTSVKLSDLKKDIAAEFATRAGTISKETWNRVLNNNGRVIGGYYDVTTETGLTEAQLNSILDDTAWNNTLADPSISRKEKETLQRFRNVISNKLDAIGFSGYTPAGRDLIRQAVNEGAAAGLGTTKHSYQRDLNFESPELRFQKDKYNTEQAEKERIRRVSNGEEPFYTDPTTKERWYSDGKLVWSTDETGAQKQKPIAISQVNKPGKDNGGVTIDSKVREKFPVYYESWNINRNSLEGSSAGEFNEGDAERVSVEELSAGKKRILQDLLNKYGLSWNDIEIYEDKDWMTRNHYKISLAGNIIGTISNPTSDTSTPEDIQVDQRAVADTLSTSRSARSASSYGGF